MGVIWSEPIGWAQAFEANGLRQPRRAFRPPGGGARRCKTSCAFGAQIVDPWLAKNLITAYLGAEFSTDEDFRRRVAKLHEMDGEGR